MKNEKCGMKKRFEPRLWGQGLVAEEGNRIKGLIVGGGGDTLPRHDGEKRFQFMLTWPMPRQPFEEVATSPEAGAVIALGRECKVFASNNLREPPHFLPRVLMGMMINKQPAVN